MRTETPTQTRLGGQNLQKPIMFSTFCNTCADGHLDTKSYGNPQNLPETPGTPRKPPRKPRGNPAETPRKPRGNPVETPRKPRGNPTERRPRVGIMAYGHVQHESATSSATRARSMLLCLRGASRAHDIATRAPPGIVNHAYHKARD